MKAVYEVTTKKYTGGTTRNWGTYTVVASNLGDALRKTETYLRKTNAGAERPDEVKLIAELSF